MKRTRKRWWTRLITLLAVLTVAAASISAGFTVLIDSVPAYRHDLEAAVARAVGHPARIGAMALTWSGPRPTLDLREVALLDAAGQPLLDLRRIRLGLSPTRLITGPRTPDRIEIDGLQLAAEIDADGQLRLDGIDLTGRSDHSLADDLARFAQLRLHDVQLSLRDARLGAQSPLQFRLDRALLRHGRAGYAIDAQLQPPEALARRIRVSARFDGSLAERESLNGRWTLDAEDLAGWPWLAAQLQPGTVLRLDDAQLTAGGAIDAGRLGSSQLHLRAGVVSAQVGATPVATVTALDLDARLDAVDGGWRLQLPNAALCGARGVWKLDGLTAARP